MCASMRQATNIERVVPSSGWQSPSPVIFREVTKIARHLALLQKTRRTASRRLRAGSPSALNGDACCPVGPMLLVSGKAILHAELFVRACLKCMSGRRSPPFMKERRKASPGRPSSDILLTNPASYTDRARPAGYRLSIYQTGRRDAPYSPAQPDHQGSSITTTMMVPLQEEQ